MASSSSLKWTRSQYNTCLNQVKSTALSLANSIESLKSLIAVQNSCYNIDDVSGGSKYLDNLLEKEQSIYSNIVNNVIPAINSKIKSLNWQIADAESKEALEKEAL